MKIAIDFEGTLTPECGEFDYARVGGLARLLFRFPIRTGARSLLRDLTRSGNSLTLYTSRSVSARKLFFWCRLLDLPIREVVTRRDVYKLARQTKSHTATWPPFAGYDLILDDEPRNIAAARRAGVRGVLVTNRDDDWTLSIREAVQAEAVQARDDVPQLARAA